MARSKRNRNKDRVSAQHRADNHKSGFVQNIVRVDGDVDFFSLKKEGIRRIDILPFVAGEGNPWKDVGEKHYERTFWQHANVGVNKGKYVCPAMTSNKKCPICEYRAELSADENANEKLIADLKPKERQLFNVIDLEELDKGVQLWDISHFLFGKQLLFQIRNSDDDDEYQFFADLKTGFILKLMVAPKSFEGGRPFYEVGSIEFKTRDKPYDEDMIEKVHCLDDILIVKGYDELSTLFHSTDGGSDGTQKDDKTESSDEQTKASDYDLEKGMKVEYEGGTHKIVKISGDETSLTLKAKDGEILRGVAPDEVLVVDRDQEKPKKKDKKKKKKEKTPEPEPEPAQDDDDGGDLDKEWDEDDDD